MPVRVSTDPIRPAERQAFWTEAICRSFANVDTRPLGGAAVSGHFEFIELGSAKLVRFDSSPQSYRRDARLVSTAGSDDFMFDIQTRGRSVLAQGGNERAVFPGEGVLYDARRPFEDRLDGPERRAEVLIVTVPAARLAAAFPDAERWCARPIALSSVLARSIAALVRALLRQGSAPSEGLEADDVVAYLAALLRYGRGQAHALDRTRLFVLIDTHLRRDLAQAHNPQALAAGFRVSERSLHRIFADRGTTFERHMLRLRVERFRELLSLNRCSAVPIAKLALACGFADAAHAARSFKSAFGATPRDYRALASPD
jgi:AraC family transcriptional regulator, positive regulator of tynA and feaB